MNFLIAPQFTPPITVSVKETVKVETTATGLRTVKAGDIIQSEAGKAGLAKTKALFARVGGSNVAR